MLSTSRTTTEGLARPITRDRIAAALKEIDADFLTTSEGDFATLFAADDAAAGVQILFSLAGPLQDVYEIQGVIDQTFPPARRGMLLKATNAWHEEHRWPRLVVTEPKSGGLHLTMDFHIALKEGVHDALLRHYTVVALGSMRMCALWLTEQGLWSGHMG